MTDILWSTPFGGSDCRHWGEPWLLAESRGLGQEPPLPKSLTDSLRNLPVEVRADLAGRGLSARSRNLQEDHSIRSAEHIIQLVPSLAREVLGLVEGLFILDVPDPCYDQSHSEPAFAGMIFVSLPPVGDVHAIRVAEGIVHEAMHLNLSHLEQIVRLVEGDASLYSPWKHEERPAAGMLHGAYVFACLRRFFELASPSLHGQPAAYAEKRREEICSEAAMVDWERLEDQLTHRGSTLLMQIRLACGC